MARQISSGYMGVARIEGRTIRCTSFDVKPNQQPSFYDHVIGINDTAPANSSTKGEALHTRQTQKRIWRPSVIDVSGGMSFPAAVPDFGSDSVSKVFSLAAYADYFDLDFWYYCNVGKTFKNCRINTFGFDIQASDILNINTSVVGMDVEDSDSEPFKKISEKLVTWDEVEINVNGYSPIEDVHITGFSFEINNGISSIYTNGPVTPGTLKPHDLRAGMQSVSGSIKIFLDQGQAFIPINTSDYAEIEISSPVLNTTMRVLFQSHQMSGSIGPIITDLPFVGVDKYFYGGF